MKRAVNIVLTLSIKPQLKMVYGLFLLISSPLISQDIQLAGLSYTRFSSAEVVDSPLNQEVEMNEYRFFLNFPKQLKNEKTILINGLQYRLAVPLIDNDLNRSLEDQQLHVVGYRLTALHQLGHQWKVLISLNPTLSSTFNTTLEGDDFLLNGTLHFVNEKSHDFAYGAGIALTSSYGLPMLIPTLQLTFSSEKGKFEMLLPRRIAYDRTFGKLTAGLQAAVNGSRYNANYSRTNALDDTQSVDELGYTRMIVGPSISYRIGKHLLLEGSGGITVARRIGIQSDHFDDEDYDIANRPFFRFGISIVPSKKG